MTTSLPTGAVTFLFTDIEGSTERWEHHRDAMQSALEQHDILLRAAIESRRGYVFKTVGDAFCAAFHTPLDALGAAIDAQRAVAAEDWAVYGPGFPPIRVRMGIHTGVAQERGGDYFGPAVNRTARLEAAGHGGQVLLSAVSRQGVEGDLPADVRLRDLGEHRLKDLRHSERISQAVVAGLPDDTRAPRTARELGARDRIVIRDPDDADPDAVAEARLVVARTAAETLSALAEVVRGKARTVVLTPEQLRAAAARRATNLDEYRLGRIAEWSQPRYRLDGRFVALTLLVDQGEEAIAGRWAARQERYDDLGDLLAAVPEPAVVVLGPPGSGKSTVLRHLELDAAIEGLRGAGAVTFFIQLNQYKPDRPGDPVPAPGDWLAARWAERNPDLPALDTLLAEGRMILLLDAFNEMPAAGEREFRERVGLWKDWLVRLAHSRPGNRVVFSCRTLDYSAPLSTPALRVPQVQIEPLSDAQVEAFLRVYSPVRGGDIWAAIAGTPQLGALRAPFFLALLVEQVEATGELAGDRAGLFTGFVRQALRREVERDNPLFADVGAHGRAPLLASRDVRRVAQWQWRDAYDLPERGPLVPRLAALAYGMQEAEADGEASQVRVGYDTAVELLDHAQGEDIVKAGLSISVLDEDPAADEVLYRHQLIQEYFAARVLSRAPRPALVAVPWRAADIRPSVRELLETLPPAETLPPLPQTGWEETTVLAAVMAADAESFIRGVMATNLALAGQCAAQVHIGAHGVGAHGVGAHGRAPLPAALVDELRWVLVARSRDPDADLRARIAAGLALGALGDPRFERQEGPYGTYLLPPTIEIAGGVYPIGEDESIFDPEAGENNRAHVPRHDVAIAGFGIGQYPVTNAEYGCFMAAGGYDNERWWDTQAGQAWQRGEGTAEGSKVGARDGLRLARKNPRLVEDWHDSGQIDDDLYERWQRRLAMTESEFEAHLAELYPGGREMEPRYWRDERYNNPAQPVVGVCWYEARAYCAWLSAQTGLGWRLPTEVEIEAAARGSAGRLYAYGEAFDAAKDNVLETRLKRPTPVGVFVEGDTPEGASDMAGNVAVRTSSLWGTSQDEPEYRYPYVATDGREEVEAPSGALRVVRGGSWYSHRLSARAVPRTGLEPGSRDSSLGFRVVRAAPIS